MAKINLLTIHYGRCYGAVMQTYATCKLLEDLGHEVNVINLIHPGEKRRLLTKDGLLDVVIEFKFWLFKKKYFSKLTSRGYSIGEIKLPYADVTVVGSDQVWNRDITGTFDMTFFLDFVPDEQKRISLSSSFGKNKWNEDEDYTSRVKQELNKFSALSVRESSGQSILTQVFGLESLNLIDPTLGYGQFDCFVKDKYTKEIFTFLLNASPEAKSIVEYLSMLLKTPVHKSNKVENRLFRGPIEWLQRIKSAKYVVTDSFHGLALSLIFNKQFFVLCADRTKFVRLETLLDKVGLRHRFISSLDDIKNRDKELNTPINYTPINDILAYERLAYQKFMKCNF